MKHFLVVTLLTLSTISFAQNPYIGTWVSYDIKSFKNLDSIPDTQRNSFNSSIVFDEDLTFVKITNGVTTIGIYEFTKNKFNFLEKDDFGNYSVSWSIRWPKNTTDPLPKTSEIDLCYPELFSVDGNFVELDVYYIKTL